VTVKAAEAIAKYKVGIKCPTINFLTDSNVVKDGLKKKWKSPNNTIRGLLGGGTLFREPIMINGLPKYIDRWKKKIIIGRHVEGDEHSYADVEVPAAGKIELVFTPANDSSGLSVQKGTIKVHDIKGPGVMMAMCNTEKSIKNFAH